MKILNIGSINIDYVYEVDDFVKSGETIPSNNFKSVVKAFLPLAIVRNKIREIIMYFGTSKTPEMKAETRLFLEEYYREDIRKTESILGIKTLWNK